jgi:phage shock protein B
MGTRAATMDWDLFTIGLFVVVLVVIRSHYGSRRTSGKALANGDQSALGRAMEVARRLEQRVDTLERLLDEDAPGWRARARG